MDSLIEGLLTEIVEALGEKILDASIEALIGTLIEEALIEALTKEALIDDASLGTLIEEPIEGQKEDL